MPPAMLCQDRHAACHPVPLLPVSPTFAEARAEPWSESSRLHLDAVGRRQEAELEVRSRPWPDSERVKGLNDQSQSKAVRERIAGPGILEMELSC